MNTTHKWLAYALLRVTFGLVFLVYGLQKLANGHAAFAAALASQFAKSPLPQGLVRAFGHVLPFAETILGALVLLGVLTVPALVLVALLMIALTFGVATTGQAQIVANNLIYALICFALLFAAEHNRLALERLWKGK